MDYLRELPAVQDSFHAVYVGLLDVESLVSGHVSDETAEVVWQRQLHGVDTSSQRFEQVASLITQKGRLWQLHLVIEDDLLAFGSECLGLFFELGLTDSHALVMHLVHILAVVGTELMASFCALEEVHHFMAVYFTATVSQALLTQVTALDTGGFALAVARLGVCSSQEYSY